MRIAGLKKNFEKKRLFKRKNKKVRALRGVYLEVPDRELLCLLGHNGAGKSTLFNILTGVLSPSKGQAFICGQDITLN